MKGKYCLSYLDFGSDQEQELGPSQPIVSAFSARVENLETTEPKADMLCLHVLQRLTVFAVLSLTKTARRKTRICVESAGSRYSTSIHLGEGLICFAE